jgi:hypothetical protein
MRSSGREKAAPLIAGVGRRPSKSRNGLLGTFRAVPLAILPVPNGANMPKKKADTTPANLMVNVFDGTRKAIADSLRVFIRVIDGNQRQWYAAVLILASAIFSSRGPGAKMLRR